MSAVLSSNGRSAAADSHVALDAYSAAVIAVAERLSPSVANVRVQHQTRRGPSIGAGSASIWRPPWFDTNMPSTPNA